MSATVNYYPEPSGGGACDFNDAAPASTRTVALASYSGNLDLSGAETIDSTATNVGDRVLVAAQTTQSQNGIWVVAAGAWTRAEDFNDGDQIEAGTEIRVTGGQRWRYSKWVLGNLGAISVGTTSLVFRPTQVDLNPVGAGLTVGTYSSIGLQEFRIMNTANPGGLNELLYCGAFSTATRLEALDGDGIRFGGIGYRDVAATKAWVAYKGTQGRPTGIPANLDTAGQKGGLAAQPDLTNLRQMGYDTETGGGWKIWGEAYKALARGTNLTDADQNLTPGTDKLSEYFQRTALTDNRTKELQNADTFTGQLVRVVRVDTAAFTLEIEADDDSTLFTFPASLTKPMEAFFRKTAVEFEFLHAAYLDT